MMLTAKQIQSMTPSMFEAWAEAQNEKRAESIFLASLNVLLNPIRFLTE